MDNRQYLREIVENINFEELPPQWNQFDLVKFSHKKKLFEFQQQALKNCLKALYFYFKQKNSNKSELFNHYKLIGLTQDLDFNLSNNKLAILSNYYPSEDSKVSFEHFINRMSFWMATGSGKTLVIVKLIEILGKLISSKELPQGNILFLSYREDLIEQFKAHVAEFNSYNFDTKINLIDLKSYDGIMRYSGDLILKKDEINIFYYRSDLISDEQKDKIIDFRNYDNNGKWYIILDEAHKGDREDSKRQMLYSILSRNGFLFNFSATFTDPRDYVTCVFNFNLSEFVKQGYGKHICLSSLDIDAFKDKSDFSTIEKQKIVLKTILLFIYIKKYWEEINSYNQKLYHRPLLVTLVNSVDTEDSDLELFFREVVKIAKNEIKGEFLESVKKELINDILDYEFKFEDLTINIDEAKISSIDYRDILKYFFNAKSSSTIEVLKIPKNKQELIFKLKSTDSPFALIKIGDISNWLKEKLKDYEIIETFDNESYFKRINNDDSLLNLLAGSRAFYEGWDSNRPNILLFLNIGLKDAKIFVLQSIGRGVRIEPKKDLRKRLQNLFNENLIEKELFEKIKDKVLFLETLFVFGTKAKNLEQIINTLNDQVTELNLGKSFIINPKIENKPLLVPVYGESKYLFESFEGNSDTLTLPISSTEFELALDFYNFLTQNNDNKIILVKYDIEPVILLKLNEIFEKRNYRFSDSQTISKLAPHLIIRKIVDFLKTKHKDLEKFEKLEKDKFIVHFKNISFRISGLNNYKSIFSELEQKIQTIKNKPSI
ncbi:MAG: DEAD/DEAH box helicase family protein [Candidatus Anstonellaceae archaeon]